jgi:hypothetical protein
VLILRGKKLKRKKEARKKKSPERKIISRWGRTLNDLR